MLAVWSTRVGVTWVEVSLHWCQWRDQLTGRERVAVVAAVAGADGVVISDGALGVASTGTRAGILALLLHAGKVVGTFSVDETLWSATNVRVSKMVFDTAAGTSTVPG